MVLRGPGVGLLLLAHTAGAEQFVTIRTYLALRTDMAVERLPRNT